MTQQSLMTSLGDSRLQQLFAHWDTVRGTRIMPARRDIDPIMIPQVLSIIFVCDYERATGRLRYRLAGEDIGRRYRGGLPGRYQDELYALQEREPYLARIKEIMETPAIFQAQGGVYVADARRGNGERLMLPLAADGRTADALIGATVYGIDYLTPPSDIFDKAAAQWALWSMDGKRLLKRAEEHTTLSTRHDKLVPRPLA